MQQAQCNYLPRGPGSTAEHAQGIFGEGKKLCLSSRQEKKCAELSVQSLLALSSQE